MNPRWLVAPVLALVPLAGCATQPDEPGASSIRFSSVAGPAAPAPSSGTQAPAAHSNGHAAGGVPVAPAETVCGSVPTAGSSATVVIRAGAANCADALRTGRVYAAAAANAAGQAVTVETGGWRCTAKMTDAVGVCREGENAFSVG